MKSIFNRSSKGFTLIELLVVIAIIAILATIILASLGTARQRARDTRVLSELSQMRAQAELFSSSSTIPDFTDLCTTSKTPKDGLLELVDSVKTSAGVGDEEEICDSSATEWAAGVETTSGKIYCVDSTGFAGEGTRKQTKCDPKTE